MSNNLSSKINHTLLWLNKNINDIKKINNMTNKYLNNLLSISKSKEGYSGKIKVDSSKYRELLEEEMDYIETDYKIYKEHLDEIYKYRNIEDVIYNLSKFMHLLKEYKKLEDVTKKIYDKCDFEKDKAEYDENYALCIGINKIYNSVYRCDFICNQLIKKLSLILNKIDEI